MSPRACARPPRGRLPGQAVAFLLAVSAAFAVGAQATPADGEVPAPRNVEDPRDAEFGVETRQHGLQRRVAMYQWRRGDAGYVRAWSGSPIDSTGFDPGHANPGFPLPSRTWLADVRIDGRPVARELLLELGAWHRLRPGFSALPGNMSATFQPEGDGLGTAANPQRPEVGDLRIEWHELRLPPLEGRIVLRDGTWIAAPAPSPRAPAPGVGLHAAAPDPGRPVPGGLRWPMFLIGIGVLLAAGVAWRRRR